jgi:hypothetical protein
VGLESSGVTSGHLTACLSRLVITRGERSAAGYDHWGGIGIGIGRGWAEGWVWRGGREEG